MDWIREDVVAVIREMCEEEKQTVVSGGDERFMNAGEDRERMASTGSYAQYAPRAQPARRRAETASIDHIIEPHHLCPPRPRPRPSLPDRDRSVRPRWMTERLCDAGTRRRGALHWQACSQLQRLADMSWSSQRRREKRCNASHQDLHTTTLRRRQCPQYYPSIVQNTRARKQPGRNVTNVIMARGRPDIAALARWLAAWEQLEQQQLLLAEQQ
jgi:hypothetical protein